MPQTQTFSWRNIRGSYIILKLKCTHPSGYAASRIASSSGALNGTGAPCNIGSAYNGSLWLGNSPGTILFSAEPNVCAFLFNVVGVMRDCHARTVPRAAVSFGEEEREGM